MLMIPEANAAVFDRTVSLAQDSHDVPSSFHLQLFRSSVCPQFYVGDVMNARFFEATIRNFEFHIKKTTSELLQFSRQHDDRTVFLNKQNCYWQSICSEEIVPSRFFSDKVFVFDTSGERWFSMFFCDQALFGWIVVLQFFYSKTMNKECLLRKTVRVGRPQST